MTEQSVYFNFASSDILPIYTLNQNQYISTAIDVAQLQKLINNNLTVPSFRIFILNSDETIRYQIPPEDIKRGGTYNESYQNGTRRTLSFTLYNYDGRYTPNINNLWAGTRLRLDLGLKTTQNDVYWIQKGIFVINQTSPSLSKGEKVVQISAEDKFSLFDQATGKLLSSYEIAYGSNIKSLILSIMRTSMGNGTIFDSKELLFHPSLGNPSTGAIITKSAGDTYGSILSELATQSSAEIFYNTMGQLTVVPLVEVIKDGDKTLVGDFSTEDGNIDGLNFDFDYNQIHNKVVVAGTTANGGNFFVEAVNDDAGSPTCRQRIGDRLGEVISDNNIYNKVLAKERADYELRKQLILQTTTSANVLFNPFLSVNNIVTVTCEYFSLQRERFLIQSLQYPLDYSNTMSIEFTNIRNLPFILHT